MHALKTLTICVVGFGRIGREVVHRLRAFKCRLVVFDPAVPAADIERAGCTAAGLDEALRIADVLTLHCPSTAATQGMIDRTALAKMKPGALLINVARGNLVDTPALIEALREGRLGGAALDVCDPEPVPSDSPLLGMSNVLLTPHVASASVPAVLALRTQAALTVARRCAASRCRTSSMG